MIPFLALLLAAAPSMTPVDEAAYQKMLAANRGKVVVVNYWATWCAPCRAEMPRLLAFGKQYAPKGVKLLVVSADDPGDAAQAGEFMAAQKAAPPFYIKKAANDDRYINAIDPKWSGALPATFVYHKTGKHVKSFFGEVEITQLEAVVKKLL